MRLMKQKNKAYNKWVAKITWINLVNNKMKKLKIQFNN